MLLIPYTVILVTVFEINCIYFVFKNLTLTPPPFQLWYHSKPGDHDLKKLETFKDFFKYPYENLTPPPKLWLHPTLEDQNLNKLKSALPEDASTQATSCLAN